MDEESLRAPPPVAIHPLHVNPIQVQVLDDVEQSPTRKYYSPSISSSLSSSSFSSSSSSSSSLFSVHKPLFSAHKPLELNPYFTDTDTDTDKHTTEPKQSTSTSNSANSSSSRLHRAINNSERWYNILGGDERWNRVKMLYDSAWSAGLTRWGSSGVVLGLAIAIYFRTPLQALKIAALTNIGVAGIHLPLIGPRVKPKSPEKPNFPKWFIFILIVSTTFWGAAMSFMITMVKLDEQVRNLGNEIANSNSTSPSGGGGGGSTTKRAPGVVASGLQGIMDSMDSLVVACACMGGSAFLCCISQWGILIALKYGKYTTEEVADAYHKLVVKKEEKKKDRKEAREKRRREESKLRKGLKYPS